MMNNQSEKYDAMYYAQSCGEPYERNETWLGVFNQIADHIVAELQPQTVLDAGCAMGFLVEALRQRGVDAWGIDISEYAIEQVIPEIQPFCKIGLITEPFPHPRYDLIICIEVIEHLTPEEAVLAVQNMCTHSDDILLSSTPFDFKEPTHVNVQPPDYWVALFNRFGFIHDIDFDASFIAPWAMRFVKSQQPIEDRLSTYERKLWQLSQEISRRRDLAVDYKKEVIQKEMYIEFWKSELERVKGELSTIRNSRSWKLITRLQRIRERNIPLGSRREVLMHNILHGMNILHKEGLLSFLKRLLRKIFRQGKIIINGIRFRLTMPGESKIIQIDNIPVNPEPQAHQSTIDVIICVHNALADVRSCLDSVVKFTTPPYNLILVDDGSDLDTQKYLADFATQHNSTLLRNEQARGYTLAANQGLQKSMAEFSILLNSDTIVTPSWVDRMAACAQSNPKIGLVGPLSNGATYQSIPEVIKNGEWAGNPLPYHVSVEKMGEWVARYSRRLYPAAKFLNGFCLMIRHEVIDQIGYFDEENFGVGYGEENDYCLRARKAGWQLAIADDTYIFHAQSKSYKEERRRTLSERANASLAQKHGQMLIDEGTTDLRENRILEGIRTHNRYLIEREGVIEQGRNQFANRRVLFVLPVWAAGGGANVIVLAAQAMRRMGVDAQIMNLLGYRHSFENSYPDIDVPLIFGDIDDIPNAATRFDAVVATFNPTVSWIAPALAKRPDLNVGYYIQDYEPYFYQPEDEGYQKAKDSYTLLPKIKRCVTTQWIYDQIQQHHSVSCHIIGASFDTDLFCPRPRQVPSWPDRPLRIAAMIRPHSERRNPRMTMEVLRMASKKYGSMLEIKLFGCKPSDPGFAPLPKDFPWHLAGELRPMQIANLLNETDIFLDFSVFQALGLTAMESMSCGSAVIVPESGGTSTFAKHEENCLVENTQDKAACFNALQRLIEDHTLRQKLQKNAIHAAVQFYPELPTYNLLKALFLKTND